MRTASRSLSALSAALLLCGACAGSGPAKKTAAKTSTTAPRTVTIGGTTVVFRGQAAARADLNDIQINDNYFEPNVITGTSGERGALDFRHAGAGLHNVSIPELHIDKDFQPGTAGAVAVVFPASGDLVFFCKYHRTESGMVGVLRVSS